MEPALGNLLITAFLLVVGGIILLASGVGRRKTIDDRHAEEDKSHTPKAGDHKKKDDHAKGGGHDDHGHDSAKWGFLRFSIGVLVLVGGILALVYWYNTTPELNAKPKLASRTSSSSASYSYAGGADAGTSTRTTVPASACAVTPSTAREVTAPVDGCSIAITVDPGTYPCTDPNPALAGLRIKSWYGSTEPSDWTSNTSGRGDHICIGVMPNADGTPRAASKTIKVWLEPLI